MQIRQETTLTAEEYASTEAWTKASRPDCPQGCERDMRGHGSYLRKTPVVFRVRRWRCAQCRITAGMLPDFAAAGRPGGLQQIEDDLMARVRHDSAWKAAKELHPGGGPIETGNMVRHLRTLQVRAEALLAVLAALLPDLFRGCPAELSAMRIAVGTDSLLVDMRRRFGSGQLQSLPIPVGFRRPGRSGKPQTGPPHTS